MNATHITQNEIEQIRQLLSEGLSKKEVATKLGRGLSTIYAHSTDEHLARQKQSLAERVKRPETEEERLKRIEYQKKWYATPKGRSCMQRNWLSEKTKARKRADSKTPQGRASQRNRSATRRLLNTNIPDVVLLDGVWCEVDRKLTYSACKDYLVPSEERKAIKAIYLEAQQLTEETGNEYHVDHLQPLSKGGEHTAFNLQITSRDENLSKANKFRTEDAELLCKRLFGIN